MAKQPVSKGGTSRIRFIMLDAEIPEGDLSEITAAIQNALKPTTTIIQQRLPSRATHALPNDSALPVQDADDEQVEVEEDSGSEAPARAPREAKPRKPIAMKALDLDLKTEPSFESYANTHVPKNDTERNLVALAWFKEHRPDEVVTANHVYTCYRAMRWPAGIDDFASILRSLKSQQLVTSPGRGQFAINHLGIDRVERLGPNA